jgi:hypothetical protein
MYLSHRQEGFDVQPLKDVVPDSHWQCHDILSQYMLQIFVQEFALLISAATHKICE